MKQQIALAIGKKKSENWIDNFPSIIELKFTGAAPVVK